MMQYHRELQENVSIHGSKIIDIVSIEKTLDVKIITKRSLEKVPSIAPTLAIMEQKPIPVLRPSVGKVSFA